MVEAFHDTRERPAWKGLRQSLAEGVRNNEPTRNRSQSDYQSPPSLRLWELHHSHNLCPHIGPIRTLPVTRGYPWVYGRRRKRHTGSYISYIMSHHDIAFQVCMKLNFPRPHTPLFVHQDLREGHFRQRCEVSAESRELLQAMENTCRNSPNWNSLGPKSRIHQRHPDTIRYPFQKSLHMVWSSWSPDTHFKWSIRTGCCRHSWMKLSRLAAPEIDKGKCHVACVWSSAKE